MPDDRGHYYFNHGLSCLFEMPTSDARRIVPLHLQPLEVQHERSVLSVTVFDFCEGDGGVFQELVLSVLVPPLVKPGDPLPKAGLYPFVVATSTEMGRREGIDRWKLPHLMRDIEITFTEGDGLISVAANSEWGADTRADRYESPVRACRTALSHLHVRLWRELQVGRCRAWRELQ